MHISHEELIAWSLLARSWQLFEDPVVTIYGHSYDRKAIERALAIKQVDPLTRKPLTPEQIFPNIGMRHAVEEYRKSLTAAKP